jgi:hypothetical protein
MAAMKLKADIIGLYAADFSGGRRERKETNSAMS